MLYKAVLLVHFLAMIAVVGGAAAVGIVLSLVAKGETADLAAYGRAVNQVNRWLLLPGLILAPSAGLWLWGRHGWLFPAWLRYKLILTSLGLVGAAMYMHLFRSELRFLLLNRTPLEDGTAQATTSCLRVVGAAGVLLLAAAVVGTLKPGW